MPPRVTAELWCPSRGARVVVPESWCPSRAAAGEISDNGVVRVEPHVARDGAQARKGARLTSFFLSGRLRESCDYLLDDRVGPLLDLVRSLILDRVRNEHRLQVGPPQLARLHPGGSAEHVRGQRYGGNPFLFESNAVVQTARCAGASVGEGFDHPIHERESLQ